MLSIKDLLLSAGVQVSEGDKNKEKYKCVADIKPPFGGSWLSGVASFESCFNDMFCKESCRLIFNEEEVVSLANMVYNNLHGFTGWLEETGYDLWTVKGDKAITKWLLAHKDRVKVIVAEEDDRASSYIDKFLVYSEYSRSYCFIEEGSKVTGVGIIDKLEKSMGDDFIVLRILPYRERSSVLGYNIKKLDRYKVRYSEFIKNGGIVADNVWYWFYTPLNGHTLLRRDWKKSPG